MGEFFILAKFQRHRLGGKIACKIFDQFPGVWEVAAMPGNDPALKFWSSVISAYSGKECLPTHQIVDDADHPRHIPCGYFACRRCREYNEKPARTKCIFTQLGCRPDPAHRAQIVNTGNIVSEKTVENPEWI